jgi:hypothetical protein
MQHPHDTDRSRPAPRAGRGFTVVEIRVGRGIVIAIIATLLGGRGAAAKRARVANTEFLMNSIVTAMASFRKDTGYLPPSLGVGSTPAVTGGQPTIGWARDLLSPPSVNAYPPTVAERTLIQAYRSATTLPEYLLGLGDRSQDGWGVILENTGGLPTVTTTAGYREQPVLGIRNPGTDGVWGALLNPRPGTNGNGTFAARNLVAAGPGQGPAGNLDTKSVFLKGKSIGPYLELKGDEQIGALVGFASDGTPQVAKPGEINNFDLAPKVILDYFGKPIMYYRRGYVNGDPKVTDNSWSLADVVALRPQRFGTGDAIDAAADANGDTSATRAARSAEFGLVSFGPDMRWNPNARADAEGYNEDNITRLGP